MDSSSGTGPCCEQLARAEKFEKEVESLKLQLQLSHKKHSILKDVCDKTKAINDELEKEVKNLNRLLEIARKGKVTTHNKGTQVFEYELIADMTPSDVQAQVDKEIGLRKDTSSEPAPLNNDECMGPSDGAEASCYLDWRPRLDEAQDEHVEEGEIREENKSIAESLREAAEAALAGSNYIYDERSGLYYHSTSGYYYDAERQLYYEPSQGIYYSFDADLQQYVEHSRVDLSQYYNQQTVNEEAYTESISDQADTHRRRKKNKSKRNQVASYCSTAQIYSKDLASRIVKDSEVSLYSAVDDQHGQNGIQQDAFSHTQEDEVSEECVRNKINRKRKSPVQNRHKDSKNAKSDTSNTNAHSTPESQDASSKPQDKGSNKPFIGPIVPEELIVKERQEATYYMDDNASKTQDTEASNKPFIGPIVPDELLRKESQESPCDDREISDEPQACSVSQDIEDIQSNEDYCEFPPIVIEPETESSVEYNSSTEYIPAGDIGIPDPADTQTRSTTCDAQAMDQNQSRLNGENDCVIVDLNEPPRENDCVIVDLNEPPRKNDCVIVDLNEPPRENARTAENPEAEDGYEDGEITESERGSGDEEVMSSDSGSDSTAKEDEKNDGRQHYAPCVRLIVRSSEHLIPGSLYIVTCTGASFGCDSSAGHTVLLTNPVVSKAHCCIQYDAALQTYLLKDQSSLHGTFLNNQRLSEARVESAWYRLHHGDEVTVVDSTFTCHIHNADQTCAGCEPGLTMQNTPTSGRVIMTKADKEKQRRKEMKQIRKKYGLQGEQYRNQDPNPNCGYTDKASVRRQTVGSDNPYEKDAPSASVHVPLTSQNVGYKMLSRMGWKEGEGLGKAEDAITEPIQVSMRSHQNAGLGSGISASLSLDNTRDVNRVARWGKAAQRYHGNESVVGHGAKVPKDRKNITFVPSDSVEPKI